jgi:hypothetical protein
MAIGVVLGLGAVPNAATADLPTLTLQDSIAEGDQQCTNLCDRYAFVWEPGTEVTIRLLTVGYPAYMNVDGPGTHEVTESPAATTSLSFITNSSRPYTVIVNPYNFQDRGAYRIEVSPPPLRYLAPSARTARPSQIAPESEESDDAALATVEQITEGLRQSGRDVRGQLDSVPSLRFPAKRGRCYRAVILLDGDARWRRVGGPRTATATTVRMDVTSPRDARTSLATARSTSRVVALDDELCPSANGTLAITFPDRTRNVAANDPGRGGFVARVYERQIQTAELDARDVLERRGACAACMQQRASCNMTGNSGAAATCADQFEQCVSAAGMSTRTCMP